MVQVTPLRRIIVASSS